MTIQFDRNVLTYTGIVNQPTFGIFNSTPAATANTNGAASLSWFNVSPALNIGSGTLLDLLFTYNSGASVLAFVNKTPSSVTDSLANNLTVTYTNGSVSGPTVSLPVVVTSAASGVTATSAQLNGTVNPSGSSTTYYFQYGITTSYGSQTTATSAGSGSPAVHVSTTLTGLSASTTYHYRVVATNSAGTSQGSDMTFTTIVTGIASLPSTLARYHLSQNYPNPFNPSTTISYLLPRTANVSLRIFNTLGQEVALLVNEQRSPGYYQVQWNASNVPSGMYFYRLQAGDFIGTKKAILLK